VLSERGRADISLTIASNETLSAGSYAEHLRQLVSDLALEDRVSFVSPTDDELWELLAATDVVVSPSHHEGLCVPIIEGYIAGARAIGTEAGNLPFIVQPPDPLVPVDDPEALADAIEAVSDAGAAGEEWHSAIDSVVRRFSRAYTARRLFDEIRHLAPEAANVTSTASTPQDQIRPWIDVQPDAVVRHRTRTSLNRMPDYSDWEPGSRFTDLLRELRQPVTIHRKSWEYGLCLLGLEQLGALRPDASAIAVGAGSEPPLFHLANIIGRMVATDLYDNPDHEGNPAMLDNPAAFAPFEYRRDRLEVYRMSGDQLAFEVNTFDIAFSLSSIEHFGSRATQRAAFDEMIRVVKPGGIICIMTELILTGHTHGEYFQWDEMSEIFLEHPGVTLVGGDVDLTISQSLIDNPVDPRDARTQNRSPHIVLDLDGMKWTSLSMFFRRR
jgi:SAM-dependent methyltransferase